MKVLVTGGAGFIGSHTVDLLLAKGYEVVILDNLQSRVHPRGAPDWIQRNKVEFILGDVANREDVKRALAGADFVIHLAAYQDYLPDFSAFIHTNAESTALLFELIVSDRKRYPVRKCVFASSQSVAGEGSYYCSTHGVCTPPARCIGQLMRAEWDILCPQCGQPMTARLISEDVASPGTAYAISKHAIEHLASRLGARYEIPSVCMRYTYVQGPRNSFYNAYSGIARIFAMRLMHGLPPICFEDGQQRRDYISVHDVARANVLVMESDRANGGIFNVGGKRAVTVLEFARIMLREFNSDLEPLIPGEFRLGDTRHTVSDVTALEALGWQPTIPVERSIHEYVRWMSEQSVTDEFIHEADRIMHDKKVIQRACVRKSA